MALTNYAANTFPDSASVKQKCCCDQEYAVSVECRTQRCYWELVANVVYDNFQDKLVPGSYTVL